MSSCHGVSINKSNAMVLITELWKSDGNAIFDSLNKEHFLNSVFHCPEGGV